MEKIDVHKNATSQAFLNIAWDIFFNKKNRGISLERHFPWLFDKTLNYTAIEMKLHDEVVGGLVVVEKIINNLKIGLVGLVCIREKFRGNGLLEKLMTTLDKVSCEEKFSMLVLWTSQHWLYKPYGFNVDDDSIIAKMQLKKDYPDCIDISKTFNTTDEYDIPLPPFADKLLKYKDKNVEFIYCEKGNEKYLLDYTGSTDMVIKTFFANISQNFTLNSFDGKLKELASVDSYAHIDITKQQIQMVKILNKTEEESLKDIRFAVYERI